MSVALTKEDSAETASETLLPDRPLSSHPNHLSEAGLKALEFQLDQAREAYEIAQKIEDINERRRQSAIPLGDMPAPRFQNVFLLDALPVRYRVVERGQDWFHFEPR